MAVIALLLSTLVASGSGGRPTVPPPIQFFVENGQVQGHRYSGNGDSIHRLDVYLGPFCEDSNAFWPTLKELAQHYGTETLEVRTFMFPLPYNFGSFIVAQSCAAAHVLGDLPEGRLKQDTFFSCVDYLYSHQHELKTASQFTQNQKGMIESWADIVSNNLKLSRSDFLLQMDISDLEGGNTSYALAKSDWKYGTYRGVFGTPAYFLNGVQLGQSADYMGRWNQSRWTEILDPILKPCAQMHV